MSQPPASSGGSAAQQPQRPTVGDEFAELLGLGGLLLSEEAGAGELACETSSLSYSVVCRVECINDMNITDDISGNLKTVQESHAASKERSKGTGYSGGRSRK